MGGIHNRTGQTLGSHSAEWFHFDYVILSPFIGHQTIVEFSQSIDAVVV